MSRSDLIHVTSALKPFSFMELSQISPDILEAAGNRGSAVHALCAEYARGGWLPYNKEFEGYIDSYKKWFDKTVGSVIYVEHTMSDLMLGIIGTLDLYCILKDGRYCLIDLKTSAVVLKTYGPQVAAYHHLLKAPSELDIMCGVLLLRKNGRQAKFVEIQNVAQCFAVFTNALMCAKFFGV
jgi:hypothetical protein